MKSRTLLLVGAAMALALAGCNKKPEEAATPAPAADAAAPGTQGIAVGEPNPSTPLPGQNINTGDPIDGPATVTAPASVNAGAEIEVGWTGPGNKGDYIDLVPRGSQATSNELSYDYTEDAIPVAKVRAPTEPGEYDVRYIVQLVGNRLIKATAPVTVTAATVTLTAPPKAEQGEPLSIGWVGPNGNGDYLDIVPAGYTDVKGEITYVYLRDNQSPSPLVAPGKPGAYQIRYVLDGAGGKRTAIASSPLEVTAASATVKASATAAKGAKVAVEWTGPKRRGDYVDLVKKGSTQTSGELSYFYVESSKAELTAPNEVGDYEVRYILEAPGGRQILARQALTVR